MGGHRWALRAGRRWVGLVSFIVPRERRSEWREEWESELWHEAARWAAPEAGAGGHAGGEGRGSMRGVVRLLRRAAGSLPHALAIAAADWSGAGFAADARWAILSIGRRPGFAVFTSLLLGFGIGGTVALFSTVNAVLLRSVPFEAVDRLVWAYGEFSGGNRASVSPPDFQDYRASSRSFADMAAVQSYASSVTLGGAEPEEVLATAITSNFFRTLGVRVRGRAFTASEEDAAASDVVMISESLWRGRFGADVRLPGGTIRVDDREQTVIGIVPAGRGFPAGVDVWLPLTFAKADFAVRGAHFLRPIVRLAPQVTLAQAQAEVDAIAARLEATYPRSNTSWRLRLIPLRAAVTGNARLPLLVLLGGAGLVLLIACANVAGLMMASATARGGELAVRVALGATRSRMFRQLLVESILIALMAGVSGVIAARWLQAGIARWGALTPPGTSVSLDGTVLGFAACLTLAVGILCGLMPAWRLADARLSPLVRETIRDRNRAADRTRGALIVIEVALAVVLVSSAALLLRSFAQLRAVDPGFRTRDAIVASARFPAARYGDGDAVARTLQAMFERLSALPGVVAVGAINALPAVEFSGDTRIHPASRPPADPGEWQTAQVRYVTEGYFDAMQIPVLEGRAIAVEDGAAGRPVAVINAALRDQFFAGENAVGQILMAGVGDAAPLEVIGVVGSVRQGGLGSPPAPEFYMSVRQLPFAVPRLTLVARSAPGRTIDLAAVRDAIRSVDPDQPVPMLARLDDAIALTVAQPRFRATLVTVFAGFALVLAALGLYALLAFVVTRRSREIGIRMALGARAGSVIGTVIRRGLVMTAGGLVIGLAGSLAAARLLRGLLFGINAVDPWSLVLTVSSIAAVAIIACLRPAVRAARIDPAVSLRNT